MVRALRIIGGAKTGPTMPGGFAVGGGAIVGIRGMTMIPAFLLQTLGDRIEARQFDRQQDGSP